MAKQIYTKPHKSNLLRPIAIFLMVTGAVGFVASLVAFGDQIIFMLGSTVMVFIGLALIVNLRLKSAENSQVSEPDPGWQAQDPGSSRYPYEPLELYHDQSKSLVNLVADHFQKTGARVTIEVSRDKRSILVISNRDGSRFTVIVNDNPDLVDLPELRALQALVGNHGSQLGYYVTGSSFTPRAKAWAAGKSIYLAENGHF